MQKPTEQDMDKLDRVLRYVNCTRSLWLSLLAGDDYGIEAYIDASYGVHPDGKGHTGVCITLGTGFFYVQSAKQKLVSKSSTEAELIGISDGLSMVLWARNFMLAQGISVGPAVSVAGQPEYNCTGRERKIYFIAYKAHPYSIFLR